MARIAFDVDDTFYKVIWIERNGIKIPVRQVPDYDVINLMILLHKLGNEIYIWSAGGKEYAFGIAQKFGLDEFSIFMDKSVESAINWGIDLTFDDEKITLGKVNIQIPRENHTEV